jgi:hypothetical protein
MTVSAKNSEETSENGGSADQLAPFRERIDATLDSLEVEQQGSKTVSRGAKSYESIDVGLSGTIDGLVLKEGPIPDLSIPEEVPPELRELPYSWLYDVPNLTLPQEHLLVVDRTEPYPFPLEPGDGNTSERYYARGEFTAEQGAGVHIVLPTDEDCWNEKLFVIQHGSGIYTTMDRCYVGDCEEQYEDGALVPESPDSEFTRGLGANLYAESMLDRGYAVAWVRKDAIRPPLGITTVEAEDGTKVRTTLVGHVQYQLATAEFAQGYVEDTLGREPGRTYYTAIRGAGSPVDCSTTRAETWPTTERPSLMG